MKPSAIIESCGQVTKEENLMFSPLVKTEYAVMESELPFPEYYRSIKSGFPKYFYFLIEHSKTSSQLMRTAQELKDSKLLNFYVTTGSVIINDKIYECIRLKGACEVQVLEELIHLYKSADVKLYKRAQVAEGSAIMCLKKFYYLDLFEEGIYLDKDNSHIGYFPIGKQLEWHEFVRLTRIVRNNFNEFLFDAALGSIQRRGKTEEIVRIYAKEISCEKIMAIREKYLYFLTHEISE